MIFGNSDSAVGTVILAVPTLNKLVRGLIAWLPVSLGKKKSGTV